MATFYAEHALTPAEVAVATFGRAFSHRRRRRFLRVATDVGAELVEFLAAHIGDLDTIQRQTRPSGRP
jgi:hypothetical protein